MACYNHPDKEAIANCSVCGRPICSDCYVEIGGNSYCKNCLNALINSNDSDNTNENINQNQNKTIENIEPIKKPKTIPYEEEKVNEDVSTEVPIEEVPEKIVAQVEKAPENYQPEYDYQTEYVETYGDEDSEDSYYENPETIPEPEPEYKKKMVADPIIPERQETQEVYEETPNNNIESKYERYLEDLYYDEPNYNTRQTEPYYDEPNYNNGPRNNQYYEEPIYVDKQNYRNEPIYPERYDDDLDYIVPVHQSGPRNNGPSYEEIKRRIETERDFNQGYDYYDEPDYGYDRRNSRQNLNDIQRMHSYDPYEKEDDSFTTVELLLTIVLIILIIIVIFYIIYLFALSNSYATFFSAIDGLVHDPGMFISNLFQN